MMRSRLGWLTRFGRRFAGHGPWHRLRWTALAAASLVFTIGFVAVTLGLHYDQLRRDRAEDLRPALASDRASASLLYSYIGFASVGEYQVLVVSVWPLRPDAPLPPGVAVWPRPGEAVLSPATLSSLGPGRADLFGSVAGTISRAGLETPGDRRVYIRPTRAAFDPRSMTPVTGFDGHPPDGAFYGLPTLNAVPQQYLLTMLAATVLVPGLLGLVLGAGLDGESRARRTRQLEALGASSRQLSMMELAECWVPLALGTCLAAVATAVFCSLDFSISWLDAHFRSADSRSAWPGLVVAVLAAFLLGCATVLLTRQARRRRSGGVSRVVRQAPPVKLATVCVIAGLLTIWIPQQSNSAIVRTLSFVLGSLVFALTVSSLLAVLLAFAGKAIANFGHRFGSSGAILGGRRLQLFPTRASRVMFGVCAAILVLGQIQLWTGQLSHTYREAVALRDSVGARLVVANNASYGPQLATYVNDLTDAAPVWTWPVGQQTIMVSGPCSAMRALGQTCHEPAPTTSTTNPLLAALDPGLAEIDFRVTQTSDMQSPSHRGASFFLVSTGDHALNVDELQRRAYREVPGGLQLEAAGQGWVDAGRLVKNRSNWTVVWGVFGILAIVIATGLALVGDILSGARDVAPLAAVTNRRRWLYSFTLWRLALPLAVAGTLSSLAYLALASGIAQGITYLTPSPWFALLAALATILTGLVLAAWCAVEIGRFGHSWRPGAE